MNKLIHEPSVAGQSLADRVMAAKHTITRDSLAKTVFKATTDEVMGPKRKHLDCELELRPLCDKHCFSLVFSI
jgi:phosphatidylinositol-binding clathrin assembly protein